MSDNKYPEDERTFETRLLFISSLFEEKFPPFIIMAKCVEHKLDFNYAQYIIELNKKSKLLQGRDPLQLLKKINLKGE